MKFVVHNTGEWERSNDFASSVRTGASVKEYDRLDQVPEFDRKQFDFMLEIGDYCLSCGNTVWQIRA